MMDDRERREPIFNETLEPFRQMHDDLMFAVLRQLTRFVRLLTRVVMWIDTNVNRD